MLEKVAEECYKLGATQVLCVPTDATQEESIK